MLQYQGKSIMEYWRLRGIAKKVRAGIIPRGATQEVIFKALSLTRPKNAMEIFGFLFAKVQNSDGSLKKDYGLVSVKEITSAFALHLVDCLKSSGAVLDNFNQHRMGAGSTAETSTQTDLVTSQVGAQAVTGNLACTNGATSNIYRTIGTLTAGSAYGCREHGVFNASGGGIMLDRSLVTAIDLNADDVVTWTYELTINAGG